MLLQPCTDPADWAATQTALRFSVLEQSWCYGAATAAVTQGKVQPDRWLLRKSDGSIAGLAQAFVRKVSPLGRFVRLVRGPLFVPGMARADREAALALIRNAYPWRERCLLWWLPELNGGAESEATMAQLGLRPMMTGYSSIRCDLRPPPDKLRSQLDGKWRNTLKAAEKSALLMETASIAAGTWNDEAFSALLGEHAQHRLEEGFGGPDARFYAAYAEAAKVIRPDGEDALLFWAHAGTHQGRVRPIAGILVLRHGHAATYAMGWSNEAGRLVKAHYRLLWQAVLSLRELGVTDFDLGGVDTQRGAGVARFKLGLNGAVFTLAGSYL
ncbi:MAG: peptidoglycan bridge formation glycyltransferase FemA/FemB family protein [Alphaproteobacteria bacterium]|nr:peptidoglycan bridge formation glycyltransferase FemA/FemB family protein [Alphaproteobacteria bacterium]